MAVVKAEMPNGTFVWYRHEDHTYWQSYDEHKKKVAGRVPGASTISKCDGTTGNDGLCHWVAQQTKLGVDWVEARDKKGEIGQGAHYHLECLARGFPDDPQTMQERAVGQWFRSKEFIPRGIEEIVYSPAYNFAGRYDIYVEEQDGTRQLWDLKTSTHVYAAHAIQLNLYELARREVGFVPAKELYVLHIRGDGSYQEIPVPVEPKWAFHALSIYNTGKEIRSHISKQQREGATVGVAQ